MDPTEKLGITLRGEYFDDTKGAIKDGDGDPLFGTSIAQATLSFNIRPVGGLAIIPEFRIDSAKDVVFAKNNGDATKNTGTFSLAAVYSF